MKRGFTLSEVLITLAIIGVIAAITLPGLRTNLGARKANTWYAKYCNILDGAIKQAMYTNDLSSATSISYDQLGEQLQAVKNNEDLYEMKDGTLIESLSDDHKITVRFSDGHIGTRIYTIMNEFEGVDCRTNGAAAG